MDKVRVIAADFERDVYKRACTHYKNKYFMVKQMENYDFEVEDRPDVVRTFWNDYFKVNPGAIG